MTFFLYFGSSIFIKTFGYLVLVYYIINYNNYLLLYKCSNKICKFRCFETYRKFFKYSVVLKTLGNTALELNSIFNSSPETHANYNIFVNMCLQVQST